MTTTHTTGARPDPTKLVQDLLEILVTGVVSVPDALAEMGITKSTIYRWLRGESRPLGLSAESLRKFVDKHKSQSW